MLSHICKLESIEKVRAGAYGFKDRITTKPKDAPSPLRELDDSDPIVLKFKSKCLEMMGESPYKSWIQPGLIASGGNGEIYFNATGNFAADGLVTNDKLGFGRVLKALGLQSILINNHEGKFKGKIEVEK
jgi:hypothetical protein